MKRKQLRILTLLLVLILGFSSISLAETENELVYVIPVREEITRATQRYIHLAIQEAEDLNADMILFELDTYGGLVDATEKIKNDIIKTNIETTCFIDNKAESAGVLFAISNDNIIMSPYGTIGSAETIPNTEKILSMWKSMLRNVAQNKGRNPEIIEAMADVDVVIDGVSEQGKLLNLTANEALEFGISDGIASNQEEVLAFLGMENARVQTVKEDWSTKFGKLISTQWISSLLLIMGFLGLIIEFFIPGFGLPGIIGGVSLLLFFGGNLMVGNASWFSIMFFVVGVVFLIIEAFIPGFGLPGIAGIILTIFGIATSMQSLQQAFTAILMALIIAIIAVVIIFKYGLNSRTFRSITLESTIKGSSNVNVEEKKLAQIGDVGFAATMMRPTGFIEIGENRFDATAISNYIAKGAAIEVIQIEGSKIVVKEI